MILLCVLLSACFQPGLDVGSTVVFSESFDSGDPAPGVDWRVEGTGSAVVRAGQLEIREDTDGLGVVAWLRREVPGDFRLGFDLTFTNNRGIGVFFFAAQGPDQSDVLSGVPRTGAYDEYIRGEVHTYSVSLHRYWPDGRNNPGSNLRRNPGSHLLSQAMPDPALEANRTYRVDVTKRGPRLVVRVDGQVVHDATDTGAHGAALRGGKIGFRLRGDPSCTMILDDVLVTRLID